MGAAAACVGLYLLLFSTPFVWWVASPLSVTRAPEAADAIVVLAGGVGESGRAGGGYKESVGHAVALYREGHAPRMILSSGYEFAFSEASLMKDLAVAQGVPPAAIILETKAVNTHESAERLSPLLAAERWRRVLLVSSPYHMRRALLVWKRTAPDVRVVPSPVPKSQFYEHAAGGGATIEQMRGILHTGGADGSEVLT